LSLEYLAVARLNNGEHWFSHPREPVLPRQH